MRIGVFICQCAGNISDIIDLNILRRKAESSKNVELVSVTQVLCSKPGLDSLGKAIKDNRLDRVVVAACSPHMYEELFKKTLSEASLSPYLLECVNIREQCAFIHKNQKKATDKALDLVIGGLSRVRTLQPLSSKTKKINKHALVIGGGIAGITCSLQIANAGYPVTLIERKPTIGGHMAQLSKAFPTMDCVPCILSPMIADVAKHPRIEVLTIAEVEKASGSIGKFYIDVLKKPRGVDTNLCIRCGKCSEACPIRVSNEFDEGIYERKAIYIPFSEAFPSAYALDFENCTKCGQCVSVCPTNAININEKEEERRIDVGAIVISTGFDLLDLSKFENIGFKHPNVINALQMERIIANELAAGKVLRRSDGKRVSKIAYILCSGSRDTHNGVPYCSRICCPYTIKQAIILKKALPYLGIWVYYTDMRMAGRGLEEFWNEARDLGIIFIRGKPGEIILNRDGNGLKITAEDKDSGLILQNRVDLTVLTPPLVLARETKGLAEKLKIALKEDGFIAEKHSKINPLMTIKNGVFAAGTALGPKDIRDSIADAKAAASEVINLFRSDAMASDPIRTVFDREKCNGCGKCVVSCPQGALTLKDGKIDVDYTTCSSCGICISSCKRFALDITHYTMEQIEAQIRGILSSDGELLRIVGFFEDAIAYRTVDALGAARLTYPEEMRIIRLPSAVLASSRLILLALVLGADAVVLCEGRGTPEAKVVEKNVEDTRRLLMECGIEESRVIFESTSLSDLQGLRAFMEAYASEIRTLGKLSPNARKRIEATLLTGTLTEG